MMWGVGFFRRTRDLVQAAELVTAAPVFGVSDIDSGVLYGTPTLEDYIFLTRRVSRAEALRVPAVKRARDLICGAIGQFPLRPYDPAGKLAVDFVPNLFTAMEPGIAPSVSVTRLVEDMLLFGRGWFRVTAKGWHGWPIEGLRLDAETVTVQPEFVYFPEGAAKVWPEVDGLIRVDSPNAGLLDSSPAIRACVALERATLNAVNGTPPVDYFTPQDGADPFDSDEDAKTFLTDWAEYRASSSTGYVPAGLNYNVAGWDPEKLQLREAREFAISEVARLTGLDAEDLSVSTTSRTYFNGQDRRRQRIEDVLGPYMTAIEGTFSAKATPRGYRAGFDTTSFLRLDDLEAAQADSALIAAKVLMPDEARAKRGLDPLPNGAGATPAEVPAPAPTPTRTPTPVGGKPNA